jgi:hypothetical protein
MTCCYCSAGILLTLCQADAKHKEAVVKAKAGPDSCCQVLHACLACQECITRHVVALLASLASNSAVSTLYWQMQQYAESSTCVVLLHCCSSIRVGVMHVGALKMSA